MGLDGVELVLAVEEEFEALVQPAIAESAVAVAEPATEEKAE